MHLKQVNARNPLLRVLDTTGVLTGSVCSLTGTLNWARAAPIARAQAPRFYVEGPLDKYLGGTVALDKNESRHAVNVLRMQSGDKVELCDGMGNTTEGMISNCDKNHTQVDCCGPSHFEEWKGPKIILAVACCSLKGGRSDWLVEKSTELGAKEFIPVVTACSPVAKGKKKSGEFARLSRWDRIAHAAMKQCLRAHSLKIYDPQTVNGLLDVIQRSKKSLLGVAGAPSLKKILRESITDKKSRAESFVLVIGPEGDFTKEEQDAMIEAGASCVGLGSNRLRVETAAIPMLAAVQILHAGE